MIKRQASGSNNDDKQGNDDIDHHCHEGRVFLRAEIKKKGGGKFEGIAYWRAPPRDKDYWKRISKLAEPEWMIVKQSGYIGPEGPGGK